MSQLKLSVCLSASSAFFQKASQKKLYHGKSLEKVRSGGAAAPIFYIISSYPTTLNKSLRKDVNIDDIIGSATL